MKNHEGDYKGFTHLSRAWYGKANLPSEEYLDEVTFGFYSPGGGTSGEMNMRWIDLGGPTAQLQCWEDSWHSLAQLKDVIDRLAEVEGKNIQPAQFCGLLINCGFQDMTDEKGPYDSVVDEAEMAERREYERLKIKYKR